jgi:hemolysin III
MEFIRNYDSLKMARKPTMDSRDNVMMRADKKRIFVEELANSITHGLGLALSIAGFVVLVALAVMRGGAWLIVSCAVYGSTLVCLYTASTLYHSLRSGRAKRVFKILDHAAIYLLIAGTYTPFTLVNLRGGWGWTLFGIVWGLAVAGVVFKLWFVDHFQILSTVIYLAMGWLAVIAAKPLFLRVPTGGLYWLLAGGVLYTIGIAFYACRKVPYNHAIWHVFVLAGSICHYFAVVYSVILRPKT